jgi:hypothetical protein
MAVYKITIYDDNSLVDRIENILMKSNTQYLIKHGESMHSKFDVIVFEKVDSIKELLKDKYNIYNFEQVDIDIADCDLEDFPLPQLSPDNPDEKNYGNYILMGIGIIIFALFIMIV